MSPAVAPRARKAASTRTPLNRERVLRAATDLVDQQGLDALSMRKLGQQLGVEAMSLYNHVANKDDILDGIVERVVGEFEVPSPEDPDWKATVRRTIQSVHTVLLAHPWAAGLLESRVQASEVRLRFNDAMIGTFRNAGFPIDLAYRAFITLDSYVYGFTLQEVSWPYRKEERPAMIESFEVHVPPEKYPHLIEMMRFLVDPSTTGATDYQAEFDFGLDLVLDGLERARDAR